jgi:hypothetical protein
METKLKRKDIIIIGVVAIIVCFFVTIAVVGSGSSTLTAHPISAFGPSWDCRPMPFGGPVCIRRPN